MGIPLRLLDRVPQGRQVKLLNVLGDQIADF
jgi:hypothetical protein